MTFAAFTIWKREPSETEAENSAGNFMCAAGDGFSTAQERSVRNWQILTCWYKKLEMVKWQLLWYTYSRRKNPPHINRAAMFSLSAAAAEKDVCELKCSSCIRLSRHKCSHSRHVNRLNILLFRVFGGLFSFSAKTLVMGYFNAGIRLLPCSVPLHIQRQTDDDATGYSVNVR